VRILVVEDDPLIREFTVEALREEGHEVIHASTGEEAVAWCMRQTGFSPVVARPVSGSLSLHKPYPPEELVQAVRQVTRSRSQSDSR